MNTSPEQALRVLRSAKDEVAQMLDAAGEHELPEGLDMLLEQLVPYAEVVARHEGHGDTHLVLERELEL